VHRTGLRLIYIYKHRKFIVKPLANQLKHPGFYYMLLFIDGPALHSILVRTENMMTYGEDKLSNFYVM
jgi:hypothetical protein